MTDTRLVAYAPNGAKTGPLPTPLDLSVSYVLNDVNALTFSYDPDAPLSSLLGQPVEVAVEVSTDSGATWTEPPSSRFLYLRDGRDPAKDDAYAIECPGYVLRLNKAVVPFTGLDSQGNRTFTNASPGAILNTLMSEAQARGALTGISWTFGATTDTAGTNWPANTLQTVGYQPGTPILQVLQGFADAGLCDYRMNGRVLQVYVNASATGMGADRTLSNPAVTLRLGRDITEAPFRRTWEGVADTAYVQGDGTATLVRTNAGAITPWGRQETAVSASGVTDTATLTIVADGALSQTAAERIERTYGLQFNGAQFLPFRDYAVGEWVFGATDGLSASPLRMRVRQITLTQDSTGTEGGNVVLNDRFLESDIGLARDIARLTSGATQGGNGSTPIGNDILPPAQVTGFTATSTGYIDGFGNPKARITLTWNPVTTNADGTPASDVDHYEVQRRRNGATTWEVYRDAYGTTITDSPYEPGEQWQFQVRAVDTVYNRGGFSSTQTVTTANDTTAPVAPSAPTATSIAPGVLQVTWNGLNNVGAAMDADFARAEVHVSTVNNFTPTPGDTATMVGNLTKAGSATFTRPAGAVVYVRLLARDTSGNPTGTGSSLSAQAGPITIAGGTRDGAAPTVPGGWNVALRQFGIGALEASWDVVPNADPVLYDVYVAAGAPVSVFDATTLYATTAQDSTVIRGLTDGTALVADTDYYIAVKVKDGDGTAATTGTAGPTRYRKADAQTISSDWVYANTVQANQIQSGSLTAAIGVVGSLSTGSTGRRVVMDATGLNALDALGNAVVSIPTDASQDIGLYGNVTAQTLTALGKVSMRAPDNELAQASSLVLQQGITPPTAPPSPANVYPATAGIANVPFAFDGGGSPIIGQLGGAIYNAAQGSVYAGFSWQGNDTVSGAFASFWWVQELNPTTGAVISTPLNKMPLVALGWNLLDVVRIGTNFYFLVDKGSPKGGVGAARRYWVQKRTVAAPGTLVSEVEFLPADTDVRTPVMNVDGTNLLIGWYQAGATAKWKFGTYNPDTLAVVTAAVTVASQPTGVTTPGAIVKTAADFGATRVVFVGSAAAGIGYYPYDTAGVRDTNQEWPGRAGDYFGTNFNWARGGAYYDGAAFRTLLQDGTTVTTTTLVSYDGPTFVGASPRALKVTTTWYDPTGPKETPQGAVASLSHVRRARISIATGSAIPAPAVQFRAYVGTGTGTRTTQWQNGAGSTGAPVVLTSLTLAGSNPPAASTFPNSSPAHVYSIAEESAGVPSIDLRADGTFRLGDMVDGSWVAYTPSVVGAVAQGAGPFVGRYKYIADKTILVEAQISVGTGANWGTPSAYTFTLPATPLITANLSHLGAALLLDASASTAGYRPGTAFVFDTSGATVVFADNAAGAATTGKFMGPSAGFSGGIQVGDIIRFQVVYEVA